MTGNHAANVLIAALVAIGTLAAPVAASDAPSVGLTVELAADGTAQVTFVSHHDLESDEEREAFGSLRDDADARERVRQRFEDRLASVAADAAAATGREMAVSDVTVELLTTDDGATGVVVLSATWTGFAAVEGDRLVVTEPFASGFMADRPVTVVPPDGYALASVSLEPSNADGPGVTWAAGTDLTGFEATFAPDEGDDAERDEPGDVSESMPGFGVGAGVVALVLGTLAVARRTT